MAPGDERRAPADGCFPAWLPALLQTTDSFYPTGAYAHSGGLETLVQLGVVIDPASLGLFLRKRVVPLLAHHELPYLGFARMAAAADDRSTLDALDLEYAATRLARENREASARIGRQRLQLLARTGAAAARAPALAWLAAIGRGEAQGHAAIVCGAQAHWLGTPVEAAMAAYFYSTLAGHCSAALKLIRIGQEAAQRLLGECLALAEPAVAIALNVSREDAGWNDPAWEIAAARHERAFARLFIS